jgi:hypothetical protein
VKARKDVIVVKKWRKEKKHPRKQKNKINIKEKNKSVAEKKLMGNKPQENLFEKNQ